MMRVGGCIKAIEVEVGRFRVVRSDLRLRLRMTASDPKLPSAKEQQEACSASAPLLLDGIIMVHFATGMV